MQKGRPMSDYARNVLTAVLCVVGFLLFMITVGFLASKIPKYEDPTVKACREQGGVPFERRDTSFMDSHTYWDCKFKGEK